MSGLWRVLYFVVLGFLLGSGLIFLYENHRSVLWSATSRLHDKVVYHHLPLPSSLDSIEQFHDGTLKLPNAQEPNDSKVSYKGPTVSSSDIKPLQTTQVFTIDDSKNPTTALSVLCSKTEWKDGLWIMCHNRCGKHKKSLCGGLNNARNRIQTCLRMAIDAGAGAIISSVTARSEDNLLNTGDREMCPDAWWDIANLKENLKTDCPQLRLQFCDTDTSRATMVKPKFRNYLSPAHTKSTFKTLTKQTINDSGVNWDDISPKDQVIMEYGDTYIGWDYAVSKEMSTIRKDLFKSLKYNSTLLKLGQQILESPELSGGAFIGVHLRGEGDWPSGFGSAQAQMQRYVVDIRNITEKQPGAISTVYVMCGDRKTIQTFRDLLTPLNYTVHDKWSLFAGKPNKLAEIESIGFDSKGIVEYEVMLNAKYWMGISSSSMSALIAYSRTVDDEHDFFETYVYPGSSLNGLHRGYAENMVLKGNDFTKLLVVSEVDIMNFFP